MAGPRNTLSTRRSRRRPLQHTTSAYDDTVLYLCISRGLFILGTSGPRGSSKLEIRCKVLEAVILGTGLDDITHSPPSPGIRTGDRDFRRWTLTGCLLHGNNLMSDRRSGATNSVLEPFLAYLRVRSLPCTGTSAYFFLFYTSAAACCYFALTLVPIIPGPVAHGSPFNNGGEPDSFLVQRLSRRCWEWRLSYERTPLASCIVCPRPTLGSLTNLIWGELPFFYRDGKGNGG